MGSVKIYHFLYKTDADILGLLEELGIREKLVFHNSSVSTYYGGKLYPFMTPVDILRFTPLSFLNRIRFGVVGLYLQFLEPLGAAHPYHCLRLDAEVVRQRSDGHYLDPAP